MKFWSPLCWPPAIDYSYSYLCCITGCPLEPRTSVSGQHIYTYIYIYHISFSLQQLNESPSPRLLLVGFSHTAFLGCYTSRIRLLPHLSLSKTLRFRFWHLILLQLQGYLIDRVWGSVFLFYFLDQHPGARNPVHFKQYIFSCSFSSAFYLK